MTLKLYNVPPDASSSMTIGAPGATVTTTVPGQNAYFTFSAVAGQRLALSMTGVTVSSGSLTLKNPDGSVLKGPQAFATAPTFIDPITLTQTGIYKLVLDPKGKAKGSVTLTGYDVPADTSAALTLGSQATGTTTVPGQRNTFTFSGTLNQRISLSVLSSDFSGTISLLKPDLSVLASTPVGPSRRVPRHDGAPGGRDLHVRDRPERRRHRIHQLHRVRRAGRPVFRRSPRAARP